MKSVIWSGSLPRYWMESPWWGSVRERLFVLAPGASGRNLTCLDAHGAVIWSYPTTSSVLLMSVEEAIITARVRDGRSHAVYYGFQAIEPATGHILWSLPGDEQLHLQKGVLPALQVSDGSGGRAVCLDTWRCLGTGEPVATPADWIRRAPSRPHHDPSIKGYFASCEVRVTHGKAIWACDRASGETVWTADFASCSLIVPSERVLGLDVDFQRHQDVSALAVVSSGRVLMLEQEADAVALVQWPERTRIETWEPSALVALLGEAVGGIIVLEEFEDGTGCLWHVT